ncbi:MAG TPA: efflux RND transporter periplasmic adaptor subunit [Tepidisphaeraceae bacterium]|nr:efflux RND transporter periplasmic adaptor subunit [Tepidisphaeraceae bacterium]
MKRLVVIALILVAAGCTKSQAPAAFKMPPPSVTVVPAATADAPLYLDEIGTCTARQYVSVIPQVTGPITQLHFVDGADVHKGELLFTIDPRPYQAALDQAIAIMHQNEAAVEYAQIEFDRIERLLPTKAVSQDDYDTKKNALDIAVAQLASAKAAVETARLNVEYCSIVSPIDGRAGQRLVDPGNVVTANQTSLLVIQTLDPIYADFTCSENDLDAVRQHAADATLKVLVSIPGQEQQAREGALTFMDTQVMNEAGMLKLRATLPNTDRYFWPGQYVKVRLILKDEKNAVLIPASAAQIGQNGSFVYVVDSAQKAEMRPVTLGQRQGDMLVVEQGVKPGDHVIATGQMMVIPGMPVTVIPSAGAAGGKS